MRPRVALPAAGLLALLVSACAPAPATAQAPAAGADPAAACAPRPSGRLDPEAIMAPLRALAADSMEGRAAGTAGGARARRYLLAELERRGLAPLGSAHAHPFEGGVNLLVEVPGTDPEAGVIVLSAHYDHEGVRDGVVYNGADDNASGVAAALAVADLVRARPLRHTLVLALFDAEEVGLRGARAFVAAPPVPLARVRLNVNLDMVGRGDGRPLWAAGTRHTPALRARLAGLADEAPLCLRFGHDGADGLDDWTGASDHAPFHRAGVPFLYLGVEDHADYHQPGDDADKIAPAFVAAVVETVERALRLVDVPPALR